VPAIRTFYPTEEEFKDPVKYIENIYKVTKYREEGGCKIVPPSSFRPPCMFNPNEDT